MLAGDVLELALADDEVAAAVFEQFTDLVVGDHPLFADEIWFVPGNHDHHLWETAREVGTRPAEIAFPDGTDSPADTRHLPVPQAGGRTARVRAAHCRAAAAAQDHEGAYASRLPESRPSVIRWKKVRHRSPRSLHRIHVPAHVELEPVDVQQTSSSGHHRDRRGRILRGSISSGRPSDRSGDVGVDVNRLYDMLQSEKAVDRMVLTLATAIADKAPGGRGAEMDDREASCAICSRTW